MASRLSIRWGFSFLFASRLVHVIGKTHFWMALLSSHLNSPSDPQYVVCSTVVDPSFFLLALFIFSSLENFRPFLMLLMIFTIVTTLIVPNI